MISLKYEKAWAEGIEKDLKKLTQTQFDQLDKEFDQILDDPYKKTVHLEGWPSNTRRLRFHNHRLIIYISDANLTVYALVFKKRDESYEKQSKELAAMRLARIVGKSQ